MKTLEEKLTALEVSNYTGFKVQYVRQLAREGKWPHETTYNKNGRPMYLFSIDILKTHQQEAYYADKKLSVNNIIPENKKTVKSLESFSASEREEIVFWTELVEEWQEYRCKDGVNKTEVDKEFAILCKLRYPDRALSIDTLYRKLRAIKDNNLEGLVDSRGKWKKNKSTVLPPMWDAFLYYFLDQAQHPVTKCYQYMKEVIREQSPELYDKIPHDASFRRKIIADLPEPLQILGRKGEKAYRDACGFYIRREYDEMQSNEYWIGDTHTFDVQSRGNDGSIHRLYLSAFMDARSGVMTGWHISTSPSSQTTLLALRDGLTRRGAIPENIYVDNGREFLTYDIGGLGHRAKKPKNDKDRYDPPPVFKRLGIKMTNAIVKNARAKTIERRFLDFKNQISRLFDTFTGGNIMERPERLKAHIKNGNIIIDEQLIEDVNLLIEYYFNYESYGGSVKADRGKPKIEVYNEHSQSVRKASEDELNLMLMRSSRVQKVGRRGVHLDINGERLDYWSEEFRQALFNKEVYYRYDPYDLSHIRVYDLEDRYIMSVPCADDTVLKHGASKEEIKAAQKVIRIAERNDKDKLQEIRILGFKTAREIVLAKAMENADNPVAPANPKVLELVRADEQPLYQRAVGDMTDLDTMTRKAEKKQGGHGDE